MNQALLLRSIFTRMWRYKAKTLFMAFGVVVAVLVTVSLQSIMTAVRARFDAFIARAYPADGLVVMGGSGPMGGRAGRDSVKFTDIETIVNTVDEAEWDPAVYAGERDVKHTGNEWSVNVIGASEAAESIRRQGVSEGEYITAEDVSGRAAVALIGKTTARNLFPGQSPLGAQLFIDGVPFTIKGVLEPLGLDVHGRDMDDILQVPYTTLAERILHIDYAQAVTFRFNDLGRIESAKDEITSILKTRHQIGAGQKDDFVVISASAMQKRVDETFNKFAVFIPLIAGTAFLLSALVILAIMQVSIKGRVAEIGVRKAVGARVQDVQLQIILEVLIITVVASIIGVALAKIGIGLALPSLALKFGLKQLPMPVTAILTAASAAIVTGVIGGLLPARRAARLDPVQALK